MLCFILGAALLVGASVTASFTGTGVEWVGPLGTNAGIADVFIDGNQVAVVDTHDPWGTGIVIDAVQVTPPS